MKKKINDNLFFQKFDNIDKGHILYTNENISEKKNINKNSKRKIQGELKKISEEEYFLRKFKKIMDNKGKLINKKKTLNTLNNHITNNSLLKLNNKIGSHLYKNLNITDRPVFAKLKKGMNLKKQSIANPKKSKALHLKSNTKKLMIECQYFSNNEKYDINEDKYNKKYKEYISSVPSTYRKINNTNSSVKNDKKIIKSSKKPYVKIELASKYKYKVNNKKTNNKKITKKLTDNFPRSILYPNNTHTAPIESTLEKLSTYQRLNSDFNSFDNNINQDKNSNYIKINNFESEKMKSQEKLFIQQNNLLKSIKVNKNNYLEKGNNNHYFNNITSNNKFNMKIPSYINTNANLASYNKLTSLKKINKNKGRLNSCKFSNEQILKIEKELMKENDLKNLKLTERAYKYNQNLKINQSSSTTEKKNISFFTNYIKNNKIYINSFVNTNRINTNGNDFSSFINNNREVIGNDTKLNFKTNQKNIHSSNKKKKKSLLSKKAIFREEEALKKLKMKIKNKALTTLNSKNNSKQNLNYDNILNTSISNYKHNYTNANTSNNSKSNKNDKKIFINNIINVNNTNENNNNIENNIINNNNCNSYRFLGGDKIKYFKNKIIGISSNLSSINFSLINQSQRFLYPNKIPKNKLQLRDIILNNNKSKNDIKTKNLKTNIIKKNNLIKYHKINPKKLNINKEIFINRDRKLDNQFHKNYESSELYIHKPQSQNFSKILPEIHQELFSEKFYTDKNNKETEIENYNYNNNNNNASLTSTLKECEYYKQECSKLSSYIINFFKKKHYYPKTELNFYKYGRLLGKGAFGKVNIALHLASGRLVAIKSFNKKKLTTRRAKRKIKTEIEVLSKLRNPFCTQIYDHFETDTHILIVMEYICGDLLSFMRKRSKISEPTAKIIFKQIIKGLQYLHKKKIVHRDIKLDNVLIDLTNTVKICDFGVSRILSPGDTMYEHCGTPAYIAPEIFRNEGYEGFSCDIWSAGVTLYYMLAGIQPFKGGKIEELKEKILKGKYNPINDISKEANDLINRMLKLNPKERINVEGILKHPWLKNVDIKNRQKLNLFTDAEKGLLAKYDVNYLTSPKEELIEVFTISNLETKDEKEQKCITKSDILAPYNSYSKEPNQDIYYDLKIENDICRFNFRAQLSNIKYELSNNLEFDNGIIKTIYNTVEREANKSKSNNEITQSLNLSLDSMETFTYGLCDDVIKDIEELIGYNKNYLVQCLRKNEINYATATYYLMLKDELNSIC